MDERKAKQERQQQSPGKSAVEIPPRENREHLTEPSWIEDMIYLVGVYLGEETPPSAESKPKSEAA